jgi:uncharacterized protein
MAKKVVLDTNIILSAFLGNSSTKVRLESFIWRDAFSFYYSDELLAEYYEVISRKKFIGKIDLPNAHLFLEAFKVVATKISVTETVSICRDKEDDFILSLCQTCKADYLITGDEDLLTLKNLGKTNIMRLSDFCTLNGLITIATHSRKNK